MCIKKIVRKNWKSWHCEKQNGEKSIEMRWLLFFAVLLTIVLKIDAILSTLPTTRCHCQHVLRNFQTTAKITSNIFPVNSWRRAAERGTDAQYHSVSDLGMLELIFFSSQVFENYHQPWLRDCLGKLGLPAGHSPPTKPQRCRLGQSHSELSKMVKLLYERFVTTSTVRHIQEVNSTKYTLCK